MLALLVMLVLRGSALEQLLRHHHPCHNSLLNSIVLSSSAIRGTPTAWTLWIYEKLLFSTFNKYDLTPAHCNTFSYACTNRMNTNGLRSSLSRRGPATIASFRGCVAMKPIISPSRTATTTGHSSFCIG